jgi:hypothetical protein
MTGSICFSQINEKTGINWHVVGRNVLGLSEGLSMDYGLKSSSSKEYPAFSSVYCEIPRFNAGIGINFSKNFQLTIDGFSLDFNQSRDAFGISIAKKEFVTPRVENTNQCVWKMEFIDIYYDILYRFLDRKTNSKFYIGISPFGTIKISGYNILSEDGSVINYVSSSSQKDILVSACRDREVNAKISRLFLEYLYYLETKNLISKSYIRFSLFKAEEFYYNYWLPNDPNRYMIGPKNDSWQSIDFGTLIGLRVSERIAPYIKTGVTKNLTSGENTFHWILSAGINISFASLTKKEPKKLSSKPLSQPSKQNFDENSVDNLSIYLPRIEKILNVATDKKQTKINEKGQKYFEFQSPEGEITIIDGKTFYIIRSFTGDCFFRRANLTITKKIGDQIVTCNNKKQIWFGSGIKPQNDDEIGLDGDQIYFMTNFVNPIRAILILSERNLGIR